MSASQPILIANVPTKVYLNSVQFDDLSEFNIVDSRFICKNTGYYFIKGSIILGTIGQLFQCSIWLYVNGIAVSSLQFQGSQPTISDLLFLNKDDYVELWCMTNAQRNIALSQTGTYLSIFKLV